MSVRGPARPNDAIEKLYVSVTTLPMAWSSLKGTYTILTSLYGDQCQLTWVANAVHDACKREP